MAAPSATRYSTARASTVLQKTRLSSRQEGFGCGDRLFVNAFRYEILSQESRATPNIESQKLVQRQLDQSAGGGSSGEETKSRSGRHDVGGAGPSVPDVTTWRSPSSISRESTARKTTGRSNTKQRANGRIDSNRSSRCLAHKVPLFSEGSSRIVF